MTVSSRYPLVPGATVVGYSVYLEGEQDPRKEVETSLVTALVCNKWIKWKLSYMYKSRSSCVLQQTFSQMGVNELFS